VNKLILLGFWAAVPLLAARAASACGGGGVTTTEITGTTQAVVASAQRIVLAFHGAGPGPATTDVVVQIGVPATNADYGVLIPVPSEPTFDSQPLAAEDLDLLTQFTAPAVSEETTTYYPDSGTGGCSIGCGANDGGNATTSDDGRTAVQVSTPVNIGPVSAVVIAANDTAALSTWLNANGFVIPSDSQPILSRYVGVGERFIAIKRTAPVADGSPTSIGIHYTLPGDHREVSLAFARLGAAPLVSFTLFVTVDMPSNHDIALKAAQPFLTIPFSSLDPAATQRDYPGELAIVVKNNGSHVFIDEGTHHAPSELSPRMQSILGSGLITRLTTVVESDALDTDVRIDQEGPPESGLLVLEHTVYARGAGFGVLGLVFGARALRRKLRR
jgi:hypothetical protein